MIAAAETPSTEDAALALAIMGNVHQIAARTAMVTWANTVVPLYASEPYIAMGMALLRPAFGMEAKDGEFQAGLDGLRAEALSGASGQAMALQEVTNAHDDLVSLGFASWANSAIPASVASWYADMAAAKLGAVYGKQIDPASYDAAVNHIRIHTMSGAIGQAMAEEKIRAVHMSFDARGMTRWDLLAIPDYVEEPYVLCAAELLAAEVGQPPVNGMFAAGERQIRQLISTPTARAPVVFVAY